MYAVVCRFYDKHFFYILTSLKPRRICQGLTNIFSPFLMAHKVTLPVIISHTLICKFDLFRGGIGVKKEEGDRSGRKFDALYNGIIQKKVSLILILRMTIW